MEMQGLKDKRQKPRMRQSHPMGVYWVCFSDDNLKTWGAAWTQEEAYKRWKSALRKAAFAAWKKFFPDEDQ